MSNSMNSPECKQNRDTDRDWVRETARERKMHKRTVFLSLMSNACFIISNILFYGCFDRSFRVFNEIISSVHHIPVAYLLFLYRIVNTPKFQWIILFLGDATQSLDELELFVCFVDIELFDLSFCRCWFKFAWKSNVTHRSVYLWFIEETRR